MAEEWRVTLRLADPRAGQKAFLADIIRDLRGHLGMHIEIGSGTRCIFLYAEAVSIAEGAEREAARILSQHDVTADSSVEHWEATSGTWCDARATSPDQATAEQASGKKQHRLWRVADHVAQIAQSYFESPSF